MADRDVQLDPEQALEWGNVALKAEDRAPQEEVEEPQDEPVVDDETDDVVDEEAEEQEEVEEPVEEYEAPAPIVTVEDPGDYTPKDYSFEFKVGDETYTVSSLADAKKIGSKHAEELSAENLFTLLSEGTEIDYKQRRDKEDYDKKKEAFDEQKAKDDERLEYGLNIANGISYLVAKGLLPKVDSKYNDADWRDPEVAKQPGVKEQLDLLNYIRKENEVRIKAGIPPFASAIDAFNAFRQESKPVEEDDEDNGKKKARRATASKVGKSTPKPVDIAPRMPNGNKIAVGRVFGSLNDLDSL